MLAIGSLAPDFALKDEEGKVHRLSDYRGAKVVLYFYPKNNTTGCTQEACNLRDNFEALKEKGVIILGISYDDMKSHKNFKEEYQLPFTLLSDSDKKVAEMYGAKGGLLGFLGAKRITYLIDEEGKIIHLFEKVDPGNHAKQILAVFAEQNQKDESQPSDQK